MRQVSGCGIRCLCAPCSRRANGLGAVELTEADYDKAYQAGVSQRVPFTLSPSGKRECPPGWTRKDVWYGDWKQTWCHPPETSAGSSGLPPVLLWIAGGAVLATFASLAFGRK